MVSRPCYETATFFARLPMLSCVAGMHGCRQKQTQTRTDARTHAQTGINACVCMTGWQETLLSPSWEMTPHTRASAALFILCSSGMRSLAWKRRNSQTVDVPGSSGSCCAYLRSQHACSDQGRQNPQTSRQNPKTDRKLFSNETHSAVASRHTVL